MNPLARIEPAALPALLLEKHGKTLREIWHHRRAKATHLAYASDWRCFERWCLDQCLQAMPACPVTIGAYLAYLVESSNRRGRPYSTQTITRRLCGISYQHREAGAPDPTKAKAVTEALEGISRLKAKQPTAAKAALLTADLRKGLRLRPPRKLKEHRDRALLLVGFAGAFRRSELVGIDVEHLRFSDEGAVQVTLLTSKTNQSGEPECIWLSPGGECCPVKALRKWLELSGITSGAVFRGIDKHQNVTRKRIGPKVVAYAVKRLAAKLGLDTSKLAGHSLRVGHVTQAFINEVPIDLIQQQTRHRRIDTLMRYRRNIDAERNNSSSGLGL